MKTLLKVLGYLGFVDLIWLVDYNGKMYLTYEKLGIANIYCHVYPLTRVGYIKLLYGGKCLTKDNHETYIKKWFPYDDLIYDNESNTFMTHDILEQKNIDVEFKKIISNNFSEGD
jgi:hypothetical protein